jgi:hypothetical protein
MIHTINKVTENERGVRNATWLMDNDTDWMPWESLMRQAVPDALYCDPTCTAIQVCRDGEIRRAWLDTDIWREGNGDALILHADALTLAAEWHEENDA